MKDKIIAITRPEHQAAHFADMIRSYGGIPLIFPFIKLVPLSFSKDLFSGISGTQWLVFTSKNGVAFFLDALQQNQLATSEIFGNCRIAAVGNATAKYLQDQGFNVDFITPIFSGKSLAENLPFKPGGKILIPRALKGSQGLPKVLEKRGAIVTDLPVYDTVTKEYDAKSFKKNLSQKIDVLVFSSPSAVFSFKNQLEKYQFPIPSALFAAIGPSTAQALREFDFPIDILPDVFTLDALTKKIQETIITY